VKRVLVITNNLNQASYRLRMEVLIQPLQKRGLMLEPILRPRAWMARRRLLRSAASYHAVILQRKLLDPSDMKVLRKNARRVYFDVDDAVMFGLSPGPLQRWMSWRRFLAVAAHAHHVVAGSEYLAELFRQYGATASVLPTVVDVDHYTVKPHGPTAAPNLVWIGSRSTLRYLSFVRPALAEAAKQIPGLRLTVIADATLPDPPLPVEHIPWSVQAEAAALCRGDIGIAPMPADPWTQGKCGFKIVQYMAAGLPVIASPVGSQSDLVADGTGLLPQRLEDWPAAIKAMADDPTARQRMGAAGRARAEERYSLQHAVDFWERLLQEA
jgi:glycosyltransferase involved in cell wall biosynthesis